MSTRQELRQEIEQTRQEFHHLLDSVPDEAFFSSSGNPAWTIGQVLYHMSIAPRMMVLDVQSIRKQSWLFRLIPKLFSRRLFDWLNARLTRYGARNLSRQFLSDEYDRAHASILKVFDSLPDSEFACRMTYPDWDPLLTGEISLAYLFGYIKRHFDSHASQIRSVWSMEGDLHE